MSQKQYICMPTHPLNKAYRPGAVDSAKVQQKIRITNNYSDFIKNFLTDDPPIPYSLFPTPYFLPKSNLQATFTVENSHFYTTHLQSSQSFVPFEY